MRLRKKWWARPELEKSEIFISDAKELKGKWHEKFKSNNDIYLELGCGRGGFVSKAALKYPDKNFVAVDLKDEVLIYVLRRLQEEEIENVRITAMNIMGISEVFKKGEIKRIFINFCNPWPKERHKKRRLTHTKFLEHYKQFIEKGCQIWFKTDDDELFEESLEYFKESGFSFKYLTRDLHNENFNDNIITEYESKFIEQGIKIKFLIAELN
ncbi:tRNA (guanosine(46)-N7)-methyltransferase TrmB [Haloimpatiens massiliensis]|uniref:tRNA (guanosine(46)-N7)-methyltransferase TrmB n=1 Tax=Haloimpatiens massiliensis TaxID=1658110 RepID=UPI000C835129|nr:tRNA (guanosine(46)-N7)-methyltransferase TrmB [Haloimpatiens massiliensis]